MTDNQPDMFDPAHVAYRKEAERYMELAAPYVAKAKEAEKKAVELCPHDDLIDTVEYFEDEYGSSCPSWTEIHVKCKFCNKHGYMNLDKFKRSDLTYMDVLLGKGNEK